MNRKQRRQRHARRRAHRQRTRTPRNVISLERYPTVKQGHIVPRVYQANFAVDERVALHVDGRCVPANIKDAGRRGPFYRRTRGDGSEIDDVETSLSFIETAVQPVFEEIIAGEALNLEHKSTLAQFFGLQIVRGPAYFEQRTELIDQLVAGLTAADIRPKALARAGGDVDIVRRQVRGAYLTKTHQFVTMINTAHRVASVIGSMRWHLLRFDGSLLAYSDHPVVIWPLVPTSSEPFARQHLGPLDSIEIRVALSAQLALLMTWADAPDPLRPVDADERFAAELNAFTIAQAERQWMHKVGHEPPVATGAMAPLARAFEPNYGPAVAARSRRRAAAARYLDRVRSKRYLDTIEIVDLRVA